MRALFIHYEVDPDALFQAMPFKPDLRSGRAYVSLVAFTMRKMRLRVGGRLGQLLCRPIGSHRFLNVRTYVRHRDETGIHFLAEWLDNPWSVRLGPITFGLPYRFAHLRFSHDHERGTLKGCVESRSGGGRLRYRAALPATRSYEVCASDSLDQRLLERYTAFTAQGSKRRFFRLWHAPWLQCGVFVKVDDESLLTETWPWMRDAVLRGANYSRGACGVWMGWPHDLPDTVKNHV